MRELRANLISLDMGLAYDDFGAGQARLNELAEVPPDYIKFDVSLIRQIHEAPPAKLQLVESLIHIARDLGVDTIAEGVELRQERDVCEQLGFDLAQGFMFGKPRPVKFDSFS
jgi:EAL domain-containing protein (putative c-di-GMP-specific phosphodiesterase class I)